MNALEDARADFADFAPDVVLHNMVMTGRHAADMMRVFEGLARRVVMLSSMDVYRMYGRLHGTEPGPLEAMPAAEDAPLREQLYPYRNETPGPDHPLYDYDKIPAERAVLAVPDLPGTVLRLPMVIGPRDYQHRLYPFLRPMLDGRPALVLAEGYAGWRSTYGYVENVARAIGLACTDDRAADQVYNVADGAFTIREMAGFVQEAAGWPGRIVVLPEADLPDSLRPQHDTRHHLVASAARIRAELGFEPGVSFAEGVRRTTVWERDNPPEGAAATDWDAQYAAEDEALRRAVG
jgi:nucleoside-diphosphate-sugar epimerase